MKANKNDFGEVLKWAHEHKIRATTDYIIMARYDHTADNLANRLDVDEVGRVINDVMLGDETYQDEILKPDFEDNCKKFVHNPERRLCGVGVSSLQRQGKNCKSDSRAL